MHVFVSYNKMRGLNGLTVKRISEIDVVITGADGDIIERTELATEVVVKEY